MSEPAPALDDLLAAHALGALDGEDRAALDRALASGADGGRLAARAASWTREIEALAMTAEPVMPSQIVRARLLQRIAQDAAPAAATSAPVERARTPWLLRAAAAVLLAVVGWGAFDRVALRRELEELRSNDQQLAAQLAAMHQQLKSANVELARLE